MQRVKELEEGLELAVVHMHNIGEQVMKLADYLLK
jgi:hypothetical protein